jgi:hypothetical protein
MRIQRHGSTAAVIMAGLPALAVTPGRQPATRRGATPIENLAESISDQLLHICSVYGEN